MRITFWILFLGPLLSLAQEKKNPPKEAPPKPLYSYQLGIDPGKTSKVTIRGLRLLEVTEVRFEEPKTTGKIIGKAKSVGVPNQMEANRVGDQEIEVEITVPREVPGSKIPVKFVGPGGESDSISILVNDDLSRIAEKEPNEGFKQSQEIQLPTLVEGKIDRNQDVDVFRFTAQDSENLLIRVQATELGSPIEPILYLYDEKQQLIATAQAEKHRSDPKLSIAIPRTGTYYLAILDANDLGDRSFGYRLRFESEKKK